MRNALSNPVYRKLFGSQISSLLGTGLITVTLALLAFEMAGERAGLILGSILAIKMIAYVGFAPIANAITSKVQVKLLLITLDVLRLLLVLLFPFVTALWQIYGLVLLFQMCSAAYTPAYQSTIPDVLPDEADYAQALSLSRLAYNLESMASPLLAGALLAFVVAEHLFFVSGLAFAVSALFVLLTRVPERTQSQLSEDFSARLVKGFRIFAHTPRLRGLFAINLALAFTVAWILVNSVVYAQAALGVGDQGFAALMAAYGSGSIIGAISVPFLLQKKEPRSIMIGGSLVLGLLPVLVLLPLTYSGALVLWAGLGLAASLVLTPGGLVITRSSAKQDRPALFAAQFSLSHSGWLITYPLAGSLGAIMPLPYSFVLLALISLILTMTVIRLWPSDDPLERSHTHTEVEHTHPFIDDEHHHHLGSKPDGEGQWTHRHGELKHTHVYYIDEHHPRWAM